MLIQILLEKSIVASKLCDIINLYPQILMNVKVKDEKKYNYEDNEAITKKIEEIQKEFKQEGRVIIRPSGTEPVIRIMIEGTNQDYITKKAQELAEIMKTELN